MARTDTEHDLSKLPQWAQREFESLKRDKEHLESALAERAAGKNDRITRHIYAGASGRTSLPVAENNDGIEFRMENDGKRFPKRRDEPTIEVQFARMMLHKTSFALLDVRTSDGRLVVLPTSANAAYLAVEPM